MSSKHVFVGDIDCGSDQLFLIAGPCVIEAEPLMMRTAERLKKIAASLEMPLIFKSSFSKDNRSSLDYYQGPGLDDGLRSNHHDPLTDTHEHVGVIERHSGAIDGVEDDWLIAHLERPFPHHVWMGARRDAGVSGLLDVIQDETSRPLQVLPPLFIESQVHHLRDLATALIRLRTIAPASGTPLGPVPLSARRR